MTTRPERIATSALRLCAALLPADRREWVHALLAETDDVRGGWPKAAWLAGGVWVTLRAAVSGRVLQVALFAGGAVALLVVGWHGPAAREVVANRVETVVVLLTLAVLPVWVGRKFGPIRPGTMPRLVRTAGYAALLLVLAAKVVKGQFHAARYAPYGPEFLPLLLTFLVLMTGYGVLVLVFTAQRPLLTRSTTVLAVVAGAAVAVAVDALQPFGDPFPGVGAWYQVTLTAGWWLALAVLPLCIGAVAAARARRAGGTGDPVVYGGVLAAMLATGTFALLLNVLVGVAVAAFPMRVPLQLPRPTGGLCETCGANDTAIPVGYRHGYWVDLSVKQAAVNANLALLAAPVAGVALGLTGAGVAASVRRPGRRAVSG